MMVEGQKVIVSSFRILTAQEARGKFEHFNDVLLGRGREIEGAKELKRRVRGGEGRDVLADWGERDAGEQGAFKSDKGGLAGMRRNEKSMN